MCLSHGMFKTNWLKKREKNQLTMVPPGHFAGASYRDDSPRDFGPQIAYACWRWFQAVFRYPCPRQGSEEGRSRPLNHMRQIPFVRRTLVPPYWLISRTRRQMWVEFVVGSRPCSERFFSGFSGFPLSSKTNISKFQFDLESEGHRFVSDLTVKCHPR